MNSNASTACFYSITESSWSKAGRNSDLKAIHQKWTIFPREDISFRLKLRPGGKGFFIACIEIFNTNYSITDMAPRHW
jgi:hypothetical protein